MTPLRLALAAAALAAPLAAGTPASATHGCVQPTDKVRELCLIPHRCYYVKEQGVIVCEYDG